MGPATSGSQVTPAVLSGFSPQGMALSPTGYGLGTLSESLGMAIDPDNDIWVAIENQPLHGSTNGSLAKFEGALDANPGQLLGVYYDNSMEYPLRPRGRHQRRHLRLQLLQLACRNL